MRECAYCLGIVGSNPRAVYCSRRCKESAKQRRTNEEKPQMVRSAICVECTETFTVIAVGPVPTRCPTHSRGYRRCSDCGIRCRPGVGRTQCRDCRPAVIAVDKYPGNYPVRCSGCGADFVSQRRGTRYCSIPCRKRRAYDLAVERGSSYVRYTGWTDQRQATYQKRRALEKGASTAVRIIPAQIYARDSWTCGLCASPVDQTLSYPHPFSVSLDHIIPISLGGAHDPANLQCAHLRCNLQKGNRVEAGQLMCAQEVGHGIP